MKNIFKIHANRPYWIHHFRYGYFINDTLRFAPKGTFMCLAPDFPACAPASGVPYRPCSVRPRIQAGRPHLHKDKSVFLVARIGCGPLNTISRFSGLQENKTAANI
jgi:hypothetical protein